MRLTLVGLVFLIVVALVSASGAHPLEVVSPGHWASRARNNVSGDTGWDFRIGVEFRRTW